MTMIIYEPIRKFKSDCNSVRIIFYSRTIRMFVFSVFLFAPSFTFAVALTTPNNLTEFVNNFLTILDPVIFFVAGLGFFGMLTGILKYVGAGGDEERLGKGKKLIIYGLVGMFIMFSFWGLAKILANSYIPVGV